MKLKFTIICQIVMVFMLMGGMMQSASAQNAIQSRIVSNFDGFDHGNLYELQNGQIWKQTEHWIWVWVWVNPKVLIYIDSVVYKMKVEQIDHAVTVERIK